LSEIDCSQVLVEIETYIDREVEVVRYEQIETHLKLCSPCLERAEFKQRLKEIVATKCCSEAVPESLMERVRALIDE
jgi:mycothiol system anti-sigma-R factor